jgi:hypothetical protein
MTARKRVAGAAVFLCALTSVARGQQSPTTTPRPATDSVRATVVTYISGQSVYVGAGRADGVREGSSLEVLRAGRVIATIRAAYLSSTSASCEIVVSIAAPTVGDSVRYRPVFDVTVAAADSAQARDTVSYRRSPSWRRPIRGHVGIAYLGLSQPNGFSGASLRQPSADVFVEASQIGGTPVGLIVDGRSRRTIGAVTPDGLDDRTLVYQVSMSVADPGSGTRVSVGRQYSAALSSVSLFDGVTAEVNRSRWGVGAFGGMQPDATTMGYSTSIREAGGYVQLHNEPDATVPWSVTTGGVDSRDVGQLNREFGFAQFTLNSQVVSLFATQEIDVNRGWKRTVGEPAVSPTSTFATLMIRPNDAVSIQGGVDNRRNVRLYRDYVSPETEFDDAYRQGAWAGAGLTMLRALRIGADARVSRGGPAGSADYYTGSLDVGRVSRAGFEAHLRSTRYTTDWSTGWLHAWSASVHPFDLVRFELNAGLRTQQLVTSAGATSTAPVPTLGNTQWIGASVDVSLGRSWYWVVTGTRDGTGAELTNQLYASLVFRF